MVPPQPQEDNTPQYAVLAQRGGGLNANDVSIGWALSQVDYFMIGHIFNVEISTKLVKYGNVWKYTSSYMRNPNGGKGGRRWDVLLDDGIKY